MSNNSYNNSLSYLGAINRLYENSDKKSFTDILSEFKCLSNKEDLVQINYSSKNFNECPYEEKEMFYKDQLQMIECLVTPDIHKMTGMPWSWDKIFKLLRDDEYAKIPKGDRKVVFPSSGYNRPVGDNAYNIWNGLQIIDIDIKDKELADALKPILFNDLNKYHWFLGICTSASGKSLHVWTKITPISVEFKKRKVEYFCNFRHKYSFVYITLLKHADELKYTKNNIFNYLDLAMMKPQQGIFISSDKGALLNTNFIDARLDKNFEGAYDNGIESINWITHPDLKDIFKKLEWFNDDEARKDKNVSIENISNIDERDPTKSKRKHYKHSQRWQLANTLTSLYGADKALSIMVEICEGTDKRELRGDVNTARIHNKPISKWAVQELNKYHGFNIKLSEDEYNEEVNKLKEIDKKVESLPSNEDPLNELLNIKSNTINLYINKNQYLGHIKDDIIKNLGQITLLEAGAGYGKTEMIKALKDRVLLILPFTSTIKAKIEADENTSDWLYYYGNKRPSLEDIMSDKNMAMTIDKFSRLNIFELDEANFKYIVIDESHLLFTSSYRSVMSPAIQRLANSEAKVIMMTGTPTGEMLFFPNITHIKVKKEDIRTKEFQIIFCQTPLEQKIEMCQSMAKDVMEGRKILYPTNKGNLHFDQIIGIIQRYLTQWGYKEPLKSFYYKKSNIGDDSMEDINNRKSIGNNDIIFCTTYLSVGIDICDRKQFSVYFDETWIAQDIEQFANRLRNNDLYIKMFLEVFSHEEDTIPIDYNTTEKLNLSFNKEELIYARDIVRTCNDMLERNEEESKFNPLIGSLLSVNRYLKYDENDAKYYIDETTYKLNIFEERYSEFSKQLKVLYTQMQRFGYDIKIETKPNRISSDNRAKVEEMLNNCRKQKYSRDTAETFQFLEQINDGNIDFYREMLSGNYDLYKGNKYEAQRIDNGLYVRDIEIVEKNAPFVLSFYKYFDCTTIKEIYEYCLDYKQNRINYAKLGRIRSFMNIDYNRRRKRLDFPIMRFLKDARDWAEEHSETTKEEIQHFLANFTSRYANSVKNVIVEDQKYFEEIFELVCNLWKIVISESKPKNGKINIVPFKLIWARKESLEDLYGNIATKEFFLQELLDKEKPVEEDEIIDDSDMKDFEHTEKISVNDIENEIPNIVHDDFDYYKYSEQDGSNERFLRKQRNTNSLNAEGIFTEETKEEEKLETKSEDNDLFSQLNNDLPF